MKIEIEEAENGYLTTTQYGYFSPKRTVHLNIDDALQEIEDEIRAWYGGMALNLKSFSQPPE